MTIHGRFGLLPAAWVMRDDLGLDEIGVLACLSIYADRDGWCFPKQATLAQHLKRSRPWVIKVLNRLVEHGLIERFHQFSATGAQLPCRYRLLRNHANATACHDNDTPLSFPDRGCHPVDTKQNQIQQEDSLSADAIEDTAAHVRPAGHTFPQQGKSNLPPPHRTESQPPPLPKTLVDQNWQPSPDDLFWATKNYPKIALPLFTAKFINVCHAKDYRYVNHSCAWRAWLAEENQRWPSFRHTAPAASSPCRPAPLTSLAEQNHRTSEETYARLYRRYGEAILTGSFPT